MDRKVQAIQNNVLSDGSGEEIIKKMALNQLICNCSSENEKKGNLNEKLWVHFLYIFLVDISEYARLRPYVIFYIIFGYSII